MRKEIYPAIFSSDGHTGYTVTFPNLLGCVTEGDTLEESIIMAEEALGLYLDTLISDGTSLPKSSELFDIHVDADDSVYLITYRHID